MSSPWQTATLRGTADGRHRAAAATVDTVGARPETTIVVRRASDRVVVSVSGRITPEVESMLRHAVIDLVHDQGNLSLDLELPEAVAPEGSLLGLLVEIGRELEERNGAFVVRTPDGRWGRRAGVVPPGQPEPA